MRMPTYEYECLKCKRVFEIRQRISEPALTVCDVCGGEVRRLLSAAPFILKGEGWYVTDYPSESRKKAMQSEKSPSASSESSGAKSDGAKTDGTKSDGAKSDGAKSDSAKSDGGASTSSSTSSGASSSASASKSD